MHLQLAGKSLSHFYSTIQCFVGHLRQGRYAVITLRIRRKVTAGLSILPWYVAFGPSQRLAYCRQQTVLAGVFAGSLPSRI